MATNLPFDWPHTLADALKDVATPLSLVAYLAIVALAIVLRPFSFRDKDAHSQDRRQLLVYLFWLAVLALVGGFAVQLSEIAHRVSQPPPMTTICPATTTEKTEYKLVWFNHFQPNLLWEVTASNGTPGGSGNQRYAQCCASKPFNEAEYKIIQRYEVAGDEQFKRGENWWTAPPYNLPALNGELLHVMDDERWYLYEVVRK